MESRDMPNKKGVQKELKQKRCLGTLFHSQSRMASGRDPLCVGLRTTASETNSALPRESVGPGDFKYICMGCSIFDKETGRPPQNTQLAKNNEASVELPYCAGVEIISAQEMMSGPVLNPAHSSPSVPPQPQAPIESTPKQKPGRAYVPSYTSQLPDDFQEKFINSATKLLNRMGANIAFMGRTLKQAYKEWSDD